MLKFEQTSDRPTRCPVCGAVGVPLERAHLAPFSAGSRGTDEIVWLCANCHAQMDRGQVREFEFQSTLAHLMRLSSQFEENSVAEQAPLPSSDRFERVDILAVERSTHQNIIVECKNSSLSYARGVAEFIKQLEHYKERLPGSKLVLAVPSRTPSSFREALAHNEIEVWDLDNIAQRFREHLKDVSQPTLRAMLLAISALQQGPQTQTPEALLANELSSLPAGRGAWSAYQRLVTRILERLFVPPLAPPLSEAPDGEGRNRRDVILPNYAESGFWAYMRVRYGADFIVADAKNYCEELGKDEALQMLHYLKEDGAGLFGLLVTRKGMAESCQQALTNHWIRHGKMVICLSDADVLQMLRLREGGGNPEAVIRQAIEGFRLSL